MIVTNNSLSGICHHLYRFIISPPPVPATEHQGFPGRHLTAEQLDERLRRMEDRIQQHFVQESNRLRNDRAEQPSVAWAPFDLSSVRPCAGTGAGFISDSGLKGLDLALNVSAGLEYTIPQGGIFFGECSTLDLFDVNRLIVGYRLRL